MWYVYIYKNPLKNNIPFYIGKGKGERSRHHLTPGMLKLNSLKSKIIKAIRKNGFEPIIEHIPCNSDVDALNLEKKLIEQFGRIDLKTGSLANHTDGGDNPPNNIGKTHPKYGKGGIYKVTKVSTREEFIVEALYHWCKLNSLNATTLKEIAHNKPIRYTKEGNPIYRKQHKGYICEKL